jgi:hypothetical protein
MGVRHRVGEPQLPLVLTGSWWGRSVFLRAVISRLEEVGINVPQFMADAQFLGFGLAFLRAGLVVGTSLSQLNGIGMRLAQGHLRRPAWQRN